MKVLHIGKYYPPFLGGIEKVNFDLVENLNKLGIETDVLCFNHEKGTQKENKGYKIFRNSVLIKKYSTPISFSIIKNIRDIYKEYDIIHVHLPNPTAAVFFQFLDYKGKIILHWHLDIVKQKVIKFFYLPFQTHLLKKADAIIVTSPDYLDASKDLQKYRDKCKVIPIGINSSYLKENISFREKLKQKYAGKKVVFSLGRLTYYKGFKYLIDAAKELDKNTIILLGGIGDLQKEIETQISEQKLEDRVILLGKIPQENIGEYYKRADVFCLPSVERSEAFGIVLLEAMSFGCPLISTSMGSGVSWVNQHNITGLVTEPKNSTKLAESIKQIVGNDELSLKFSKNAQKRYLDEFQLESMVDKTIKLYKEI